MSSPSHSHSQPPHPSQLSRVRGRQTKILVLNPNSSAAMTDGLRSAVEDSILDLGYATEVHAYTAPSPAAPASIDDAAGITQSAAAVLADPLLRGPHPDPSSGDSRGNAWADDYDGILVACFSVHPLVRELLRSGGAPGSGSGSGGGGRAGANSPSSSASSRPSRARAVIGIFEASILAALLLLPPPPPTSPPSFASSFPSTFEQQQQQQWGIVTTGKFWEEHLSEGVRSFLGSGNGNSSRFAGVQSTGLNASDFHSGVSPEVVRQKLGEATKRLLGGGRTTVIVMGCAGMAGLEEIIRGAAAEEVSERFAYDLLHVVDGVRAGLLQLDSMIKHQRLRAPRTASYLGS
ncbi:hypothetical protein SLS62_010836 [Diatrype stigma]|uniref:DCG1 protein n=1 Tax=Diatrype stigma TaxID=117547 RepID=A0AAN9U7G6_9PEZI